MYHTKVKGKIDKIFDELQADVNAIIADAVTAESAINDIASRVSSVTVSRSKSILSDLLGDLSDEVLKTPFFESVSRQNRFMEINLRQEIFSKYQFSMSGIVDYKEAGRIVQALKYGSGMLVAGGAVEVGIVLIQGLSPSALIPIPIAVLVCAAIGVALVDYIAIEPTRSKKNFAKAVNGYLDEAKGQFLNWFDEVERYFNKRVDEIKQSL